MKLNEDEPQLKHYWNKVDKKTPIVKLLALFFLCAVIAYLLSHVTD